MTITDFVSRAVSVPFIERGRGYSGWDCYGLLITAFRDVFGKEIPDYSYNSVAAYRQLRRIVDEARPMWREVAVPRMGDVAYYELAGKICHVGLVLDSRRILHCEARAGTFVENINNLFWSKKFKGFYRCLI